MQMHAIPMLPPLLSCTQADVGDMLAGERGASILPVLLTHSARTREEERNLQQSLGIGGFSDMSELLQVGLTKVFVTTAMVCRK